MKPRPKSPLRELTEFALHGSRKSLQEYFIKVLAEAANLEKELKELQDALGELRGACLLAEFLLEHGEELMCRDIGTPKSVKNGLLALDRHTAA